MILRQWLDNHAILCTVICSRPHMPFRVRFVTRLADAQSAYPPPLSDASGQPPYPPSAQPAPYPSQPYPPPGAAEGPPAAGTGYPASAPPVSVPPPVSCSEWY